MKNFSFVKLPCQEFPYKRRKFFLSVTYSRPLNTEADSVSLCRVLNHGRTFSSHTRAIPWHDLPRAKWHLWWRMTQFDNSWCTFVRFVRITCKLSTTFFLPVKTIRGDAFFKPFDFPIKVTSNANKPHLMNQHLFNVRIVYTTSRTLHSTLNIYHQLSSGAAFGLFDKVTAPCLL